MKEPLSSRPLKRHADLLLTNGNILTLSPGSKPISEGALAVVDGRIVAVGAKAQVESLFEAAKTIDARGGLIMPGLVNAHTHAAMSLFRGLADDLPLKTWLEDHIFPAEQKWVNEEFVYWGTLLAVAEMIRSGTTTFADGYFFEEQAALAVQQSGMRAISGAGNPGFPYPRFPLPCGDPKKD